MRSEKESKHKSLFGSIFEPETDFYELLNGHAQKTLEGMRALADWVNNGSDERCQTVRDLENEADTLKLEIGKRLVESFITPFDREDIYDLSQSMDEVINAAKATVREIEAFSVSPAKNPSIREMVGILLEGTECLALSFAALKQNLTEASRQASLARKAENRLAKAYRVAMQELLDSDDIKLILRVKEVYKTMLIAAERIDRVGERLLHAIVKMT